MPFLERSRANPAPSNQISFSLTLFNTPYHPQASSPLSQNLLSLTHHIATNIHEARRLLGLKAALLHPEDHDWMVAVIIDNEAALRNVAHLIEPARHLSALPNIPHFDKINNNNKDKVLWTLEDDEQVRHLHQHLSVSHASLMTMLSVLYLQDLRWVFSAGKQQEREPEEEEAAPPPLPASNPLLVEPPPLRRQKRTTRQRRYVQCGATTESVHIIIPPPLGGETAVIDDPHTWQQQPPPASPPDGEREQLQHSKSDPTPQSCHHHHHHHHQEDIRPPPSSRYRHEHISSSYLATCRLTAPWTTEFDVSASGEEEEGEAVVDDDDVVRESSASSIRDENDAEELELPPRLSAGVRRRWSADVLRL